MTEILWTGEEIEAAVKGRLMRDFAATGIQIDSRNVNSGDVFFAVPGTTGIDGHDYIADAVKRGAAGVVVERGEAEHAVIVDNSFKALEDLGQAAIARCLALRIAITGSVGKTTCRSIAEFLLSQRGKTHASVDSLNNKWGVPLSLARMPRETEYGVFEVGMNHANEITPLSKQIAPHIAIITSIASVHIEYLRTIENIALAKAEIFHSMDADGIAILPRDSEQYALLLAEARTQGLQKIKSFGLHPEADTRLLDVKIHQGQSQIEALIDGRVISFTLGIPGAHHALNALAVLTAMQAAQIPFDSLLPSLAEMKPVTGRGNQFTVKLPPGNILVIDETHNASPIAVEAALRVLAQTPSNGRRLAILGDMLELGQDAAAFHASLAKTIAMLPVDHVLTAGRLMANLAEVLPANKNTHYADSAALAEQVTHLVQPGDVILIKGSRGAQMRRVVDALKQIGQVGSKEPSKILFSA